MLKSGPQGRLWVAAGHVLGYAIHVQQNGARTPGTLRRASRGRSMGWARIKLTKARSSVWLPRSASLNWDERTLTLQARICV